MSLYRPEPLSIIIVGIEVLPFMIPPVVRSSIICDIKPVVVFVKFTEQSETIGATMNERTTKEMLIFHDDQSFTKGKSGGM